MLLLKWLVRLYCPDVFDGRCPSCTARARRLFAGACCRRGRRCTRSLRAGTFEDSRFVGPGSSQRSLRPTPATVKPLMLWLSVKHPQARLFLSVNPGPQALRSAYLGSPLFWFRSVGLRLRKLAPTVKI